ncbi:MAG: ABC transporter substrate-binding protein [Gemmatimonadota bacterium]
MRFRAFLLSLGLWLAFADCDRERSASDSTLRILYSSDESSLQPGADNVPKFLVFSSLASYDSSEAWNCGQSEPGLADRWEHSPDWRIWTIHLREDARWHDGIPVTAHDVVFTMNLWADPDVQHWAASSIESATALDDHTVRIVYRRPSREPLNGWDVFYPRHLLEDLDRKEFWTWDFWTHPLGSGPYRYVRHVPKTMMEFEADSNFFGGRPRIERVIVKWGGGNPVSELLGGSVDAVEAMSNPNDAARLARDSRFRVYYSVLPAGVRIYWNIQSPLFREAPVRRAFTQAIDRPGLHQALSLPAGLPLTDGLYTDCQFERRQLVPPWPYDPEEAGRLLDEAGWQDEDRDGVREKEGIPLAFTLIAPSNWLQASAAAVFVQDQLRRVGARMEVQSLDYTAVGERFRGGEFEAAIWPTSAQFFGTGSPMGYDEPRVAALLKAADSTVDPAAMDRIYREISGIVRRDLPTTFLYPKVDMHAARRELQGIDPDDPGDLFMSLADLWWQEDR